MRGAIHKESETDSFKNQKAAHQAKCAKCHQLLFVSKAQDFNVPVQILAMAQSLTTVYGRRQETSRHIKKQTQTIQQKYPMCHKREFADRMETSMLSIQKSRESHQTQLGSVTSE